MTRSEKEIQIDLLKKYCKPIVHMRQEFQNTRFGLIFGAGIGRQFGFPKWDDLVIGIAKHEKINRTDLINDKDNTLSSQLLFQHYRAQQISENHSQVENPYNELEIKIKTGWTSIVSDVLYRNVPQDNEGFKKCDKYINNYLNIMKNQVTVNFNFDDTLERLLYITKSDKELRGYKSVCSEHIPRIQNTSIVYHPNGFLPSITNEKPSRDLIFLEDSFQDQLISSILGQYSFLVNHLSQVTCLFIGHSLSDAIVKYLLRHNAIHNPGQYHYFVHYIESGLNGTDIDRQTIFNVNFDVYNLITLFLNDEEISALGILLNIDEKNFNWLVEQANGYKTYKYYITGPVAVGKSTALSHYKNLSTYEEWVEPLMKEMEKDPSLVESEKIKLIDNWVADQWAIKNAMINQTASGIYVIDRCPLDAFAFTKNHEWKEKAKLLRSKINPGRSSIKLCPGHIIFLKGDPEILAVRAIATHRKTTKEKLEVQQNKLAFVVSRFNDGVSVIDIREKSISQVVKEVAKIVHENEYTEAQMDKVLKQFEKGKFDV